MGPFFFKWPKQIISTNTTKTYFPPRNYLLQSKLQWKDQKKNLNIYIKKKQIKHLRNQMQSQSIPLCGVLTPKTERLTDSSYDAFGFGFLWWRGRVLGRHRALKAVSVKLYSHICMRLLQCRWARRHRMHRPVGNPRFPPTRLVHRHLLQPSFTGYHQQTVPYIEMSDSFQA